MRAVNPTSRPKAGSFEIVKEKAGELAAALCCARWVVIDEGEPGDVLLVSAEILVMCPARTAHVAGPPGHGNRVRFVLAERVRTCGNLWHDGDHHFEFETCGSGLRSSIRRSGNILPAAPSNPATRASLIKSLGKPKPLSFLASA